MSTWRPGPGRALTAAALVPVPLRRRRGLLRAAALMVATAAAASAGTVVLMRPWIPSMPAGAGAAAPERSQLQQQLEQTEQLRLALRVAQAHGAELERQIDTLAQRARQCQEELVFFRQAGRRPVP